MGSTAQILWGMFFGAIGGGYFLYGKKQKRLVPFLSGIGLCVYPYFIDNVYAIMFIGMALIALPYFIKF